MQQVIDGKVLECQRDNIPRDKPEFLHAVLALVVETAAGFFEMLASLGEFAAHEGGHSENAGNRRAPLLPLFVRFGEHDFRQLAGAAQVGLVDVVAADGE